MTRPRPARPSAHRLVPRAVLPVALALLAGLGPAPIARAARAAEPPAETPPGTIEIGPTAPPAAAARRRVESWTRVWSVEWSPLAGAYRRLVAARRAGRPLTGLGACETLGRGLLTLDRERLFPVPDPAADRHLHRALDRLVGTAVECLRGRPHAAGHALDQARRALGAARRVLSRYRIEGPGRGADP